MNTTTKAIVNLNKASSIPLLVLKDDSADPNKVVPEPLTCTSITVMSKIDITSIMMLTVVAIVP
tara:strand:+ start:959 stop:1150 length:192 start_codon:yes stop_codon:yes gene_type:complete